MSDPLQTLFAAMCWRTHPHAQIREQLHKLRLRDWNEPIGMWDYINELAAIARRFRQTMGDELRAARLHVAKGWWVGLGPHDEEHYPAAAAAQDAYTTWVQESQDAGIEDEYKGKTVYVWRYGPKGGNKHKFRDGAPLPD
jgi:hypothetical protein